MTKRIVAKVGEYQKDGETKGEYQNVGVILSNENGEYVLLDPGVSLAGILAKQNALAMKSGKQHREMVMSSIFEDQQQQQAPQQGYQQHSGYQQQPDPQQHPSAQGYQQPPR